MRFLEQDDLPYLFELVKTYFAEKEDVPDYENEIEGAQKLLGIFSGAKQDYYPTLVDKACYYFVQINKDHFFSNGNKRIALISLVIFVSLNDYEFVAESKEFYRNLIKSSFPTFSNFEDDEHFTPEDFGFYNLSIIIADSHKYTFNFDELKSSVRKCIVSSVIPATRST